MGRPDNFDKDLQQDSWVLPTGLNHGNISRGQFAECIVPRSVLAYC